VLCRHVLSAKLADALLRGFLLLNEYTAHESTLFCPQERTTSPCPEPDDLCIHGVLTRLSLSEFMRGRQKKAINK
jgi:hypothetical protein